MNPFLTIVILGLGLTASLAAPAEKIQPEHPNADIVVTLLRGEDARSCSTDIAISSGEQSTFRCGKTSAISEITWTLTSRNEFGDMYRFTRTVIVDGKPKETNQRDVLYTGRETILWQDEEQRISIRPRPVTD